MNLINDINFQKSAIVSKVLAKNNSGNATLFVIDKGEKISEHTSPFLASVYCIEGKLQIIIGSELHEVANNDFLILPQNIPHSLEAMLPTRFILLMLK